MGHDAVQDDAGTLRPHPLCDVCAVGRGGAYLYLVTGQDDKSVES